MKRKGSLDTAGRDLDQLRTQLGRDTDRMIVLADGDLNQARALMESGAISVSRDIPPEKRSSRTSPRSWWVWDRSRRFRGALQSPETTRTSP